MIRRCWTLLRLILVAYTGVCVAVALFATAQSLREPRTFAPADVIVVLSAGMDADGTLHQSTRSRVEKGVALYREGVAPVMHMTGGAGDPGGPSAGAQMRLYAVELGVPASAITAETRSKSTLQNALFSMPYLAGMHQIILVTEGAHQPRSWASFYWAGWQQGQIFDIALARSEAPRSTRSPLPVPQVTLILREGAAWGLNVVRAAVWQVAGATGIPRVTRDAWLR